MSRVHEALRRAEQEGEAPARLPGQVSMPVSRPVPGLEKLLSEVEEVAYNPAPGTFIIDPSKPRDAHSEEFRALRTRLNHMQKLQPIHSIVVSSPSPAEGKSFTAVNLAVAEAQLAENPTLLVDFDFRRPVLHSTFQLDRSPGVIDYLLGKAPLSAAIKRLAGTNLYLLPAGESVLNPLEMINLTETRELIEQLPSVFNWVILDSPPLLFAADANLLATICDGTILVVRIGTTTVDSITRAIQSLCENKVLGVVANGARAGELYSKYTYYYSSYYYKGNKEKEPEPEPEE